MNTSTLGLTSLLVCLAAPVSAATVIHENKNFIPADAPAPDEVFNDFKDDPSLITIPASEDTSIYGYLTQTRADGFTLDLGDKIFSAIFNWKAASDESDVALTVNGTDLLFTEDEEGSFSFGGLTGLVTVVVDPSRADESGAQKLNWDLQLVVAPLPAGMWLLLSGLGLIAATRRIRA